jgi:hypothetical protein
MIFVKEESVFSLSRVTAGALPGDITLLFEEFYCYLLLAGLLLEGQPTGGGCYAGTGAISNKHFRIDGGCYNNVIAEQISTGLKQRFLQLRAHQNVNPAELRLLMLVDRLFDDNKAWTAGLTGIDLFTVSEARNFSPTMKTVARYVSVMFGRTSYPDPASVPKLYLSALGNIHLSRDDSVLLGNPELPYGSRHDRSTDVTPLWALLSAQLQTLSTGYCPGEILGDMLSKLKFMVEPCEFGTTIPVPVYAAALYMQRTMGIDDYNPVAVSASFYQSFLYGSNETRTVSRAALLGYLLDLMVKKSGDTDFELFAPNSLYWSLRSRSQLTVRKPAQPALLKIALEALDDAVEAPDPADANSSDAPTADEPETDPQTDDGGFDPAAPTPTAEEQVVPQSVNIIGLISFDKTGEGVDEDLYRSAVVALNDKLKADDTLPVSADVREALDYWVNGFLYRTAISSTKDQVVALKLQKYFKKF